MGHQYQAVQWNKNKVVYDLYMIISLVVFIGLFMVIGLKTYPSGHTAEPVGLMIRALGSAAFSMLTIVLMIGPLARLSPRFNPFLYNRRHLGVTTFLVSFLHFVLALMWYHAAGPLNPFVSLFVSNPLYDSIPGFPFEILGLAALIVLFLMAATSHDFWLNNLSAPVWKALHMLIYPAYAILILHITLGALYTEKSIVYAVLTLGAFGLVAMLHLTAGFREWRTDSGLRHLKKKGWVEIGSPLDIPEKRAVIAPLPGGERVAVFRYDGKIAAITNVCRHQNGPLGEGRVIDGCIVCPWHGWQYSPEDGISPPPFTEKVATYNVRIENGVILIDPKANKPGARVEPAIIDPVSIGEELAL